ncbi:MAG: hypothetical protein R3C39_16495 [Dehalococcoidia bacterium]
MSFMNAERIPAPAPGASATLGPSTGPSRTISSGGVSEGATR